MRFKLDGKYTKNELLTQIGAILEFIDSEEEGVEFISTNLYLTPLRKGKPLTIATPEDFSTKDAFMTVSLQDAALENDEDVATCRKKLVEILKRDKDYLFVTSQQRSALVKASKKISEIYKKSDK